MDMYHKMKSEADDVADNAEKYIRLQGERLKLELIERISVSLTELIQLMITGFFLFGGMVLLCVAVSLVIQEFTGNWIISASGATLFFAIMALVAIRYGKRHIRDAITRVIIQSTYDNE